MIDEPGPNSETGESEAFRYGDTICADREDLAALNRRAWTRLARAGTWWTGAERVAIANEVRVAATCVLCADRKAALSPNAIPETHAGRGVLSATTVDTVHRLATDHGRLSKNWVASLRDKGISDGQYVELVGVVGQILHIDTFHDGLGLPLEPLPAPLEGEPSRRRPGGLRDGEAWVPLLDPKRVDPEEADLFAGLPQVPFVLRALSLVPDAVRSLIELENAYYLGPSDFIDTASNGGHFLSRSQLELVAARVSAFNECFY
jgi:alkylhydroperoxidase family enzyme